MQELSIPTTFSIDFVGDLFKLSELISKARVRIYYKGGNRNGTWITNEVAEKLNKTLPHVPIVASYNAETEDFEDHADNGNKKAYGFIPSEANLEWVKGSDGKEYLEADVYLWTGYWEEASKIINKSQSMELDKKSIAGDWKVVNGDIYFVYQNAAFKGLCALGDAVLPCFEEASFYSLDEESQSFFQDLNGINEKNSGGEKMQETLNTEVEVFETPAEVDPTTSVEETVNFTEETAPEAIEEVAPVEEFATETEAEGEGEGESKVYAEGDSVTLVERHNESIANADGSTTWVSEEKIHNISVETYYALQAENEQLKSRITALENENASLMEYQKIVVKNEKMEVIEQFRKRLSDEEISNFVESLDSYTTDELKTKLSVVLAGKILQEPDSEKSQSTQFVRVPDKVNENGTIAILRKYKKN